MCASFSWIPFSKSAFVFRVFLRPGLLFKNWMAYDVRTFFFFFFLGKQEIHPDMFCTQEYGTYSARMGTDMCGDRSAPWRLEFQFRHPKEIVLTLSDDRDLGLPYQRLKVTLDWFPAIDQSPLTTKGWSGLIGLMRNGHSPQPLLASQERASTSRHPKLCEQPPVTNPL